MTVAQILIIDDDKDHQVFLRDLMQAEGYETIDAFDGSTGLRLFHERRPHLVISDLEMPLVDGIEVCRCVRSISDVPVLIISGHTSESSIDLGFDAGAVDYIRKPVSPRILKSRVRAVLRTMLDSAPNNHTYQDGYLQIDICQRLVTTSDTRVLLTTKEYEILVYLFENAGTIMSHQQILTKIWGWEYQDSTHYLYTYINSLRNKIEPVPAKPEYIITEPGTGYCFQSPIQTA